MNGGGCTDINHLLFSSFPREIGYYNGKFRNRVYDESEFKRYITLMNGLENVYVSVYDVENYVIDKVVFDIDSSSIEKSKQAVISLLDRLRDDGIDDVIVVFSGYKGFHVYVLVKKFNTPDFSFKIALLRDVEDKYADGIKEIDRHLVGNLKALIRVPNTIHIKTGLFSVVVDDIRRFRIKDARFVKEFDREVKKYDIKDMYDIEYVEHSDMYERNGTSVKLEGSHEIKDVSLLKNLIRPCVYKHITEHGEPDHMIRTDFVSELMFLGYSEEDVVKVISKLGWIDYDERKTRYHVRKIYEKGLYPMTCKEIKRYVDCFDCGWQYFWR